MKRSLSRRSILVVLCGVLITAACNSPKPTAQLSPLSSPISLASGIPTPMPKMVIPTPESGAAVIYGQFQPTTETGKLLMTGTVYAAAIEMSQGPTPVPFLKVSFDVDPRSMINPATGEFAITSIKPGQYAILVHTPIQDYAINDDSGHTRLITVTAGQSVDLGTLILP